MVHDRIHAAEDAAYMNKEAADDHKKKMKKLRTMKRLRTMKKISEIEVAAADFDAFVGNQDYAHHRNRNNHGKSALTTTTPNYMKPTTSSDARKEQRKIKPSPSKLLTRKSSLRVVRPSSTMAKTTAASRIQQETPTSADAVCRYDHCSLNGHAHRHRTSSPIKTFISSRRRLLKTQKTTKLRGISSFIKRKEKAPKPDTNHGTSVDNIIIEFDHLELDIPWEASGDQEDCSSDGVAGESPPVNPIIPIVPIPNTESPLVQDEEESFSDDRKHQVRRKMRGEDEQESVREFNPRGPNYLAVEAEPEGETVDLKHQDRTDDWKNSDEWMIDYALRRVVGELGPARNSKVELLVEAFETVAPADNTSSSASSFEN